MQVSEKIIPFIFILAFFSICTCDEIQSPGNENPSYSLVDDDSLIASPGDKTDTQKKAAIMEALSLNGLVIKKEKLIGGDTGCIAHNGAGKNYLVLQGSSYNMGYQMGSLLAPEVEIMAKEFIRNIAADTLGMEYSSAKILFDYLIDEALTLCRIAVKKGDIPAHLIEEMRGIVDGAASEGYSVSFDDLLLLNCGSDSIYSIMYTGTLPSMTKLGEILEENPEYESSIQIKDDKVYFPLADELQFGCNAFIVTGDATADGKTYHGRDFMYSTGGIYQDHVYMGVYLPDRGYPFISVTAPGWVCAPTIMNSRGVSMGVEVVMGAAVTLETGIGCLMVIRDTVQNSGNLDEAVEHVKSLHRGVPWLFVLADNTSSVKYTRGVVLETGRSTPSFTGPDLLPSSERWLLSGAPIYALGKKIKTAIDYISNLDADPLPDRGVMARNMSWKFPEEFEGIDNTINIAGVDIGIQFPEQMESWPDAVLVSNHYLIPRMRFTSLTPWMQIQPFLQTKTSSIRYEKLHEVLALEYGNITFDKARDIIDYLNPNSKYRDIVALDYYEAGGPIRGHHAVIDNEDLVLECLYGYYGDGTGEEQWAAVDLKPFLKFYQ